MNQTITLPILVAPEVTAYVAGLGYQTEFQRMLEYASQSIPGLKRIRVFLQPPYDIDTEDQIIMEAFQEPAARTLDDQTWLDYSTWKTTNFSPDVYRHFTLLLFDEVNHAG